MRLCKLCNSANANAFDEGECHICEGKALQLDAMLENAGGLLKKEKIRSFSISTMIPKEWLTREEDVWDIRMGENTGSIKGILNKKISSSIAKTLPLEYQSDGDCRIVFDFDRNEISIRYNQLFIFGRYKKIKPGLSQSRWICSKCGGKGCKQCGSKGKNYESVEERIGEPLKQAAGAGHYTMHASGREDVDATNSAGRAFVIELDDARNRTIDLEEIAKKIAEGGEVEVQGLQRVERSFVETVTESHFDKTYEAEVEVDKELAEEDLSRIKEAEGETILQQTPKRVVHRRANKVRHRKIKMITIKHADRKMATLIIKAEAGTYIKEFISGDEGRTKPSIAGLLNSRAQCKRLEVTQIDDAYLDFCLDSRRT